MPNIALAIIDQAIQMHGAAGVSEDFPLAEMFASIRTLRIADGPDEVHRALIAGHRFGPDGLPQPPENFTELGEHISTTERRAAAAERSAADRYTAAFLAERVGAQFSARIGGVTPWLKTAHLAETFNVRVCPHFLMELHVALCCAVPNARWLEYIPQLDDITAERRRSTRATPCRARRRDSGSTGISKQSNV